MRAGRAHNLLMEEATKIQVGDFVEYMNVFRETYQGIVIRHEDDIANGRPGFDLAINENGVATVWGYDYQIVRHIPSPLR